MLLLEGAAIKYYVQERLLLDLHDVKVYDQQIIGLVGRNGSGKTTLLKMIAGELVPNEGMITSYTSVELVPQFKRTDTTKSGGEMTQAYLQDAFNHHAGLLLLDEPTTNLDTEHIEWLEKKLTAYQGALILVSHDRAFLDQLCTEIWEIEDGILTIYKGNYSQYVQKKEEKRQTQQEAFEKYEKEKQQLEEAIRKKEEKAKRATRKPKNLSSSEARLTGAKPYFANKQKKLRKTVSAFETRLEQMEEIKKPKDRPTIQMNIINEAVIKNQVIVRAKQLSGEVDGKLLYNPIDFYLRGGDKLAIIGANGVGKTTLVKSLLDARDKRISISSSIQMGYFDQHMMILDEETSILENVQSTSTQNETLIRTVLARMNFVGDDVHKRVNVLSGGEKVKIALSRLFLSDVNMLVLDEPTNFLDIESIEALELLLQQYTGSVIFVSHDRMFIKNVASKILEIKNKAITFFEGTYDQYQERVENQQKDPSQDQLLVLETKITDVLSRLSIEPSEELEKEFQRLIKEKQNVMRQS